MDKTKGKVKPVKRKSPFEAATVRLLKAVQSYVAVHNGRVLVAGGIEIQQWPEDRASKFKVAIDCVGKRPAFPPDAPNPPTRR